MDASADVNCPPSLDVTPKLRKNRRIENKWGLKYYTAIKAAVFSQQCTPYTPPKPPLVMNKDATQPESLYICKQCKDRFRFQSSYEEHAARRSWILGYWCQHCFLTICTHMSPEGSPCSECVKFDRDKRSYLRNKGLPKSQKLGVVRVFYNQCQFFAHLRSHRVSLVDMGDLMLLPIPTSLIGSDWSPQLDKICGALIEHSFILKMHLIDWLKLVNAEHNWWCSEDNEEISNVIENYQGDSLFKICNSSTQEHCGKSVNSHGTSNTNGTSPSAETSDTVRSNKRKNSSQKPIPISVEDESVVEYEDNPCTAADIAFVDCGPAAKSLVPEAPSNSMPRKHTTIFVKTNPDSSAFRHGNMVRTYNKRRKLTTILSKCSTPDVAVSYGNTTITPKIDSNNPGSEKSNLRIQGENDANVDVNKDSSQEKNSKNIASEVVAKKPDNSVPGLEQIKNLHMVTVNTGPKILTFQNSTTVDLTAILTQLTPQGINKKIVVIGQDSNSTVHQKKSEYEKKLIPILPDLKGNRNGKSAQAKVTSLRAIDNINNRNGNSQKETKKRATQPQTSLTQGKVLYQNGRKYLIKPSKPNVNVANVPDVRNFRIIKKVMPETKGPTVSSANPKEPDSVNNHERMPGTESNTITAPAPTPTPSVPPSEPTNSSSGEAQSKQTLIAAKIVQKLGVNRSDQESSETESSVDALENLSFRIGNDDNLYLTVKPIRQKIGHNTCDTNTMITKCKQEMLNEFFHLPYTELKKKSEHLEDVNNEITHLLKCVAESVVKEKLKALHILQHVLKHCMEKTKAEAKDSVDDDILHTWESEIKCEAEKTICVTCNKLNKPKSYVPGFSKPPEDDSIYCACYKQCCHTCNMYQGNQRRFVAHQNFHRKEKPYICPDCYQGFPTFKLLEIHTWTICFHTLKKRVFRCKICEIDGFGDIESITRHFAIMHSNIKVVCKVCQIVVPSYCEYKKHMRQMHPSEPYTEPTRVVLCKLGQCIVRWENYMPHMEKHLVEQRLVLWFRCPFCLFVDLEAKQLMSHLQNKHLDRLPELVSNEALWEILPAEFGVNILKNNPELAVNQSSVKFVNEEPCEDGLVLPRIISARTITSEVFERGAQETDDEIIIQPLSITTEELRREDKKSSPSRSLAESMDFLKIEKVKLENSSEFDNQLDMLPKILDVRSIADTALKSSDLRNENLSDTQTAAESKDKTDSLQSDKESLHSTGTKSPPLKQEPCITIMSPEVINKQSLGMQQTSDKPPGTSITTNALTKIQKPHEESENPQAVRSVLSKPPPLARIPQHILEQNLVDETNAKSIKLAKERMQSASAQDSKLVHQMRDAVLIQCNLRTPSRIALNGPKNSKIEDINFRCHLCDELINTSWSVISTHFKSKHSPNYKLCVITLELEKITDEFIDNGYKEQLRNKKRKIEYISAVAKRRRRCWSSKKYVPEVKAISSPGLGLCVQQETAEDGEGNFKCKKCNQRCTDMANLREHIASNHRIRGRYLICLECGENFVVAPSLQMHLKAFHGIEDPITYMTKNTAYAPDNIDESEEETKTTDANQCYVCMAVFEDKAAVDKHLRVHGMAFLNRRMTEARNALKSPEKSSKPEDEQQSPSKEILSKEISKESITRNKSSTSILDKISASI